MWRGWLGSLMSRTSFFFFGDINIGAEEGGLVWINQMPILLKCLADDRYLDERVVGAFFRGREMGWAWLDGDICCIVCMQSLL